MAAAYAVPDHPSIDGGPTSTGSGGGSSCKQARPGGGRSIFVDWLGGLIDQRPVSADTFEKILSGDSRAGLLQLSHFSTNNLEKVGAIHCQIHTYECLSLPPNRFNIWQFRPVRIPSTRHISTADGDFAPKSTC